MSGEDQQYGLILMDNANYTIGILSGTYIQILQEDETWMPSKHRQGGQSAQRFERIHEELEHNVHKSIAEKCNNFFLSKKLQGILIGGAGQTKQTFVTSELLAPALQHKILGIYDCGYTGIQGVKEMLEKASSALQASRYIQYRNAWNSLWSLFVQASPLICYGYNNIKIAIEQGKMKALFISETKSEEYADIVSEAEKYNTEIHYLPENIEEHTTLLTLFRGIVGVLRF